jgi:hypothetical protein
MPRGSESGGGDRQRPRRQANTSVQRTDRPAFCWVSETPAAADFYRYAAPTVVGAQSKGTC